MSLVFLSCSPEPTSPIHLLPVVPSVVDGAAPGALAWACAASLASLETFFHSKALPLERAALRNIQNRSCHIYFEPSRRGFHASPDTAPVSAVTFAIDSIAFAAQRNTAVGDSLDIAKAILAHTRQPLDALLLLSPTANAENLQRALAFHFPNSSHHLHLQAAPLAESIPWTQDYLKHGFAQNTPVTLVPHRSFEGRRRLSAESKPLLDAFTATPYVRSKLSWEGGDLQFSAHPRHPSRLVLFYGTTARRYWGEALTLNEFEYVLRQEFGAAEAVYLGDVTPHVDYLISFLPAAGAVMVSEPICRNLALAGAAWKMLLAQLGPHPPPDVTPLASLAPSPDSPAQRERFQAARTALQNLPAASDPLTPEIRALISRHCPNRPGLCLQPPLLEQLLHNHRAVVADWATRAVQADMQHALPATLLQLIESQLLPCDRALLERMHAVASLMKARGYRVVRVPYAGIPREHNAWPGLNYANSLAIADTLFVPAFGFDDLERAWFDKLQRDIGPAYRVVPLNARRMMLRNGGLHCVTAVQRALSGLHPNGDF